MGKVAGRRVREGGQYGFLELRTLKPDLKHGKKIRGMPGMEWGDRVWTPQAKMLASTHACRQRQQVTV